MQDKQQWAVLNSSPHAVTVLAWIDHNSLLYEIHLNRTRFWVPLNTEIYTEFALRWADVCFLVTDPELVPGVEF